MGVPIQNLKPGRIDDGARRGLVSLVCRRYRRRPRWRQVQTMVVRELPAREAARVNAARRPMANASTADLCRVSVAILLFGGVLAAWAHAQQTTPSQPIGATPQDLAKSVHNPFEDFVKVSLQSTTGFSIGPNRADSDPRASWPTVDIARRRTWSIWRLPASRETRSRPISRPASSSMTNTASRARADRYPGMRRRSNA